MATSKAKRPVLLAQPKPQRRSLNPQPAELMPVKTHAYRAIAELNGGFDKVIQDLQTLERISFFQKNAAAMHNLICRIRAQANRELMTVLSDRETANFGHFDQLCIENEKTQTASGS
jgi:hypothetical protein